MPKGNWSSLRCLSAGNSDNFLVGDDDGADHTKGSLGLCNLLPFFNKDVLSSRDCRLNLFRSVPYAPQRAMCVTKFCE